MSAPNNIHSNQNIATEAAEWFMNLQGTDVSRERQAAFADWLRRSPVHVDEFLQLTALQGDLAQLPEFKTLDIDQELARLQICAGEDKIIPLLEFESAPPFQSTIQGGLSQSVHNPKVVRSARPWMLLATAAAIAGAIGFYVAGPGRNFLGKEHYKTDIGEQRSVTLADGSRVYINALSKLNAKVDKTVRELQLEDGEALFKVAKDPAHPFRVHTPQATIEARGTQFNVHVSNGTTVVSLLEGHVLVTPPAARNNRGSAAGAGEEASPAAVMLNPGEQISIAGRTMQPPKPHAADLKAAVAWTEHRLVFEDAPLSGVIAEFNRYSRQPFAIHDPALGDLHITVSFDLNSTQTFADSLSAAGGLRVTQQPDGTWLIERK